MACTNHLTSQRSLVSFEIGLLTQRSTVLAGNTTENCVNACSMKFMIVFVFMSVYFSGQVFAFQYPPECVVNELLLVMR